MIKRYVMGIEEEFILKPQPMEVGTGLMIPTFFGQKEITKRVTQLVPDYEKTNIEFADKIANIIKSKAKELGEITKIELEPNGRQRYKLIIRGYHEFKEEIEVPENYGDEVKE